MHVVLCTSWSKRATSWLQLSLCIRLVQARAGAWNNIYFCVLGGSSKNKVVSSSFDGRSGPFSRFSYRSTSDVRGVLLFLDDVTAFSLLTVLLKFWLVQSCMNFCLGAKSKVASRVSSRSKYSKIRYRYLTFISCLGTHNAFSILKIHLVKWSVQSKTVLQMLLSSTFVSELHPVFA